MSKKYKLQKDYPFANISIQNFENLNSLFHGKLPAHLKTNYYIKIEIKDLILDLHKNECGLSFSNCEKLILLLNSSLISEASIAGVIIIIDPPWYPFEYSFTQGKGTDTAKILFEAIFLNPAFELFYLKLICRHKIIDHRFAVTLTHEEGECLGNFLMNEETNIKHILFEFIGKEGALGITEYVCLELVYALLKSKVRNIIFKIIGNKKNGFMKKKNRSLIAGINLLKRTKKFTFLKISYA